MRRYFLDSTDKQKIEYNQNDFARFHNNIIGSGVANPDALKVTAKTNMDVALALGWIFAIGYGAELEETKTLTHDVADPDNDRIDRVVIRFDTNPEKNDFYPIILKGTPADDPAPPSITRDNYIHDMSVAQVRVVAGKSHIEQHQISDERSDDSVCGYIPLHNIYRGLEVSPTGMISMPNQTHATVYSDKEQALAYDTTQKINFTKTMKDAQGEFVLGESKFVSKTKGYILVNAYLDLRIDHTSYRFGLSIYKNGERYQEINYIGGSTPNVPYVGISGSGIVEVDKGDELEIYLYSAQESAFRGRGQKWNRVEFFKIA